MTDHDCNDHAFLDNEADDGGQEWRCDRCDDTWMVMGDDGM